MPVKDPKPEPDLKDPKPEPDPEHPRQRRSLAAAAKLRFQQKYGNMLVIDDLDSHKAHTLCESSSSAGPNFLNPKDGFFCDMETKTVYPVCEPQNNGTVCFDVEQNELGKLPAPSPPPLHAVKTACTIFSITGCIIDTEYSC